MSADETGRGERGSATHLTRRQFDAVIRRATELALHDSDAADLSETEVYRIAGEIGVPEKHVRRALAEVRSGGLGGRPLDRLFGPEIVVATRRVPGRPAAVASAVDEFLVAGRLLQALRRGPNVLHYRPAVDWISQVARVASATSRRYYVASAKSVEVRLEEASDGHSVVEFRVEPGTRSDAIGTAVMGGGAGGALAGTAAGFALATIAPLGAAVVVGAVAGMGVASAAVVWTGRSHQRKIHDVRLEVEGILDQLEMGETLEPPPASWRQWVRRQFHGARKTLGEHDLDEDEDLDGG